MIQWSGTLNKRIRSACVYKLTKRTNKHLVDDGVAHGQRGLHDKSLVGRFLGAFLEKPATTGTLVLIRHGNFHTYSRLYIFLSILVTLHLVSVYFICR